jgi:putative tryptophan/tyrosine transport system substrate-binding protein
MPPALALPRGLPTDMGDQPHLLAGNLIGCDWTNEDMLRRLPHDVIRILEGTPAGDLPGQQSGEFNFVIKRKSAYAQVLTIPPDRLLLADEVIQ